MLATTLFRNYDAGSRSLHTQVAVNAQNVRLDGWIDYRTHTGYALATGVGFAPQLLRWNLRQVGVRPATTTATTQPPLPMPRGRWQTRAIDPTRSDLDTVLGVVAGLAQDRPENPLLLQQAGALWLGREKLGDREVTEYAAPPSDTPRHGPGPCRRLRPSAVDRRDRARAPGPDPNRRGLGRRRLRGRGWGVAPAAAGDTPMNLDRRQVLTSTAALARRRGGRVRGRPDYPGERVGPRHQRAQRRRVGVRRTSGRRRPTVRPPRVRTALGARRLGHDPWRGRRPPRPTRSHDRRQHRWSRRRPHHHRRDRPSTCPAGRRCTAGPGPAAHLRRRRPHRRRLHRRRPPARDPRTRR